MLVAVEPMKDAVLNSGKQPALEARNIRRREKAPAAEILHGISAVFQKARLTALVGADGAGKTTFMRILAGILPPSEGEVLVFGENLYRDVSRLQKMVGYMPQKFGLYEDLSVAENFSLYADLFGLSQADRRERTAQLLAMTGLSGFTERPAGKLSGGMKQKLGLACALLNHPRILPWALIRSRERSSGKYCGAMSTRRACALSSPRLIWMRRRCATR